METTEFSKPKDHTMVTLRFDNDFLNELKLLAKQDNRTLAGLLKHLIAKGMSK